MVKAKGKTTKAHLWSIPFLLVFLAEYMLQIGLYTIRPIVSSYAVSLGSSFSLAGLLSGILSGVALLCRPLCGLISDRFNQISILLIASAVISISFFGSVAIPTLPSIGIFESLKGAAFTFKSALVISVASLLVPKERLGLGIGIISTAFTTAGAIGPVLSASLVGYYGYSGCYIISGIFSVLGTIALAVLRVMNPDVLQKQNHKPTKEKNATEINSFVSRFIYLPVLPFSLIAGMAGSAYGAVLSLLFLIEKQGYIENAEMYFVAYTCTVVIARIIGGELGDKKGAAIVVPLLTLSLLGSIPLVFSGSQICVLIGAFTMALGQGSAFAILQAEAVRDIPKEEVGKASNTFLVVLDLGMFVSPLAGGFVLSTFGFMGFFAMDCFYLLAGLLIAVRVIAKPFSSKAI